MTIKSFFAGVILLLICSNIFSQDIFINKDTTIDNTWQIPKNAILKFGSHGHISGRGTIKGGIVDAALTQWIFDTTLTIIPEGTYGKDFSAKWFGAGYVKDNFSALQKGINTVLSNQGLKNFFIPKGVYEYSRSLKIANINRDRYEAVTIHMYGESSFWDCCAGTTLKYTATDGFALGLQLNKGTEINNLNITGQFKSPGGTDSVYYNIPYDKYTDANGKCGIGYTGIVIDYDGSKNNSGSTGVKVHDMNVGNFAVDYFVSPNAVTFNADILIFENIRCGDAIIGFASGQAQEKGNVIRGIYSWGSIHTLFTTGRFGKGQAGNYTIDGGNIAGRCIRLFDINQSGWYSTFISNIFAESIATIGKVNSQIPSSISNSTFHFKFPNAIGNQILFTTDRGKTKFSNCIFRYYGLKDPMRIAGNPLYDNCFFSGAVIKE